MSERKNLIRISRICVVKGHVTALYDGYAAFLAMSENEQSRRVNLK